MTRSRGVVFDAVGTVIYPTPAVDEVYSSYAARYGIFLTPTEVHGRLKRFWSRVDGSDRPAPGRFPLNCVTSNHAERSFWLGFVSDVFATSDSIQPLFEDLWNHFALPCHWQLFADVLPTWQWLADEGFAVSVASNFDARLHDVGTQLFPADLVSHIWTSADIGWRKPSPYFFDHIERQMGLPPQALAYVGDNLTLDILPARSNNWRSVQIQRNEAGSNPRNNPRCRDKLTSLHELPAWLSIG
ncbi:MAG: HAD-IA family hydrolase [Planctomycetota bacterium]|nr:HAD-IA family hydrolase [Planctomycetota bacterium]